MARIIMAALLNLTVPGTGLILLGRAWLGFAIAVWFCLAAEAAIMAKWIAPATTPWGLAVGAAILAGLAWLLGQGLFASRLRDLGSRLPAGLFSHGAVHR